METVILVCIIVATLAFVVLVVFAVRTLMQVYNTARQVEHLVRSINQEMDVVTRITTGIGHFFSNTFPVMKYASLVGGLVSGWLMKRKKSAQEERGEYVRA